MPSPEREGVQPPRGERGERHAHASVSGLARSRRLTALRGFCGKAHSHTTPGRASTSKGADTSTSISCWVMWTQNKMLVLVSAPLLVLARPGVVWLWAL